MEMVSIPLASLESSLEYFAEKALEFHETGNNEMAGWAEGRASAYRSLLETWNTPEV